MFIERRLYPRYPVDLPVTLSIERHAEVAEFPAKALNLSQNGIQLSSDAELVACLVQRTEGDSECLIRFQAPGADRQIKVRSRLVVSRRISQDCYLLGFKLVEFLEESEGRLIEYLSLLKLNF